MSPLGEACHAQGRLFGEIAVLGLEEERASVEAEAVVEEAVTTSAIEGGRLSRASVRSSVARRLGLTVAGLPAPPRHVDGLVEMLLDATHGHDRPLTAERLQGWQAALFPAGYSGISKVRVGAWREGPMQVLSGPVGKERVHYEAPPAERVPATVVWETRRLRPTERLVSPHSYLSRRISRILRMDNGSWGMSLLLVR